MNPVKRSLYFPYVPVLKLTAVLLSVVVAVFVGLLHIIEVDTQTNLHIS